MRSLLEEHVPRLYRFALRLTGDPHQAEDLTQETVLRAWRHRRRLRDRQAARVWLFRIAANIWRDQMRRVNRGPKQQDFTPDDHAENRTLPDRHASDREDVQRAIQTMDSLPQRQREVLYLHACEQLSLTQIAEILDISGDAVKASLSLARNQMRRKLGDLCPNR